MFIFSMEILYEDNHLLAVNKKSGILVHGDQTGDESLLDLAKQYIKEKYHKPGAVFLQPVHRIDRPTSGIVLFARTSKATTRITKLFKAKEINKQYHAIVSKQPQSNKARLTNHLLKNSKNNTVNVVKPNLDKAKESILDYEIKKQIKGNILLRIVPITGRSHQIRVQLAHIGCPIVGDFKYGSKQYTDGRSIGLHASSLSFIHPIKKEQLTINCSFPENDIWRLFQ